MTCQPPRTSVDLALPQVGGPRSRSGHHRRTASAAPSGNAAGPGELLLEPRRAPAGTAYVARERCVDAVAEARHQVTLRRGQQSCTDSWPPRSSRTRAASETHHCPMPGAGREVELRIPVARRPAGAIGCAGGHRRAARPRPTDPARRAGGTTSWSASARAGPSARTATTACDAFEVTATSPSTHYARTWLQAVGGEDGEVVGVAELELPLSENTDVAWAEVQRAARATGAAGSGRRPVAGRRGAAPEPPAAPGSGAR